MLYYKVKPEYDNYARLKETRKGYLVNDGILVANELFTPTERNKMANSDNCFILVNVNKNRTYFFFGARFEME